MEIRENQPTPASAETTYDIVGLTKSQAKDLLGLMGYIGGGNKSRRRTFDPLYSALYDSLYSPFSRSAVSEVRQHARKRLHGLKIHHPK